MNSIGHCLPWWHKYYYIKHPQSLTVVKSFLRTIMKLIDITTKQSQRHYDLLEFDKRFNYELMLLEQELDATFAASLSKGSYLCEGKLDEKSIADFFKSAKSRVTNVGDKLSSALSSTKGNVDDAIRKAYITTKNKLGDLENSNEITKKVTDFAKKHKGLAKPALLATVAMASMMGMDTAQASEFVNGLDAMPTAGVEQMFEPAIEASEVYGDVEPSTAPETSSDAGSTEPDASVSEPEVSSEPEAPASEPAAQEAPASEPETSQSGSWEDMSPAEQDNIASKMMDHVRDNLDRNYEVNGQQLTFDQAVEMAKDGTGVDAMDLIKFAAEKGLSGEELIDQFQQYMRAGIKKSMDFT